MACANRANYTIYNTFTSWTAIINNIITSLVVVVHTPLLYLLMLLLPIHIYGALAKASPARSEVSRRSNVFPLFPPSLDDSETPPLSGNLAFPPSKLGQFLQESSTTSHPAFSVPVPTRTNTSLTLAYLVVAAPRSFVLYKNWKTTSGALAYAVDRVNQENLIPGVHLSFVTRDTRGKVNDSLLEMSHLWRDGVVAFIGLANECKNEALVAAAWNLPLLSHLCPDDEVSDKTMFPTFARTFPTQVQITKSVISLLKTYNWNKFSIVYGKTRNTTRSKNYEMYMNVAMNLRDVAQAHNLSINHMLDFAEPYVPMKRGNPMPNIIQTTYTGTRVYVFLGYLNALIDFMVNLNQRGLLDTGLYVVIYVEIRVKIPHDINKYFRRTLDVVLDNLEGARSLLVVRTSPHAEDTDFLDKVREFNQKEPFNFSTPWEKKILTDASVLYDAVMLYAYGLAEVLKDGGSYLDGKAIVAKLLGHRYSSIGGYNSKIDENGNAEGNFSLMAYQHLDTSMTNNTEYNVTVDFVGQFQFEPNSQIPKLHFFEGKKILWRNGGPPVDEPPCGYLGERCLEPENYVLEIVGGVLGGMALLALLVSAAVYRNWRYEQEIAGLLWKIDASAIQCSEMGAGRWERKMVMDENVNAVTNCGISMVSMESRNSYAQVYTYIGKFKGQTVALKTFNLSSDLTRRDKMEMKLMRDLRHTNVNSFIGACLEASVLTLVSAYCVKGSLQDVLENDDIKLDHMFIASLTKDLIQGMMYIHASDLVYHGNLKSSNCVVTSRWTLQVADMGLLDIRHSSYKKEDHYAYYKHLLWTAPELLRNISKIKGSQHGDVYALAIILHEIHGRAGPYGNTELDPQEIVERVMRGTTDDKAPFRPDTSNLQCDSYVIDLMTSCWAENPDARPDFRNIWNRLKPMRAGMKRNIFDHMLSMMEKYQEHLEELVDERTEQLSEEKKKTETLLYRMLPRSVADQLKRGESVIPESFDSVTIYFSDICGFTSLSADSTPMQIVNMLNDLYTCFDSIIKNFDVYKVETIGDAYMVVSGIPIRNGQAHAAEIASMSLALLKAIKSFSIRHRPSETLKLRIGIHSGPCVAGVVGLTMPRYTLFGDTVNTASRMESNGEALKIHCSKDCKEILDSIGGFHLEERGLIPMKGKGNQLTYWLRGEDNTTRTSQRLSYHGSCSDLNTPERQRRAHPSPIMSEPPSSQHQHQKQPPHQLEHPTQQHSPVQHHQQPIFTNAQPQNIISVFKVTDSSPKINSYNADAFNGMQRQFLSAALKEKALKAPKVHNVSDNPLRRSDSSMRKSRGEHTSSCQDSALPTENTTLLVDYIPLASHNGTHV